MLRFTATIPNSRAAPPARFDPCQCSSPFLCPDGRHKGNDNGLLSIAPQRQAPNPLVRKLQRLIELRDGELLAIEAISRRSKSLSAHQTLIHEGSRPQHLCVMLDGIAYRYKYLKSGQRQILGYLVPGDMCDLQFLVRNQPDHSVSLLTEARVALVPIAELTDLLQRYPTIERGLLLASLIDEAMLRMWLLNVGQRGAFERLGHFLCEISVRLGALGQIDPDGSFAFPVTQTLIADTIGLTSVHVNRTLQRLRIEGLAVLRQGRLTILDFDRLADIAGFDPAYLGAGQSPATDGAAPSYRHRRPADIEMKRVTGLQHAL